MRDDARQSGQIGHRPVTYNGLFRPCPEHQAGDDPNEPDQDLRLSAFCGKVHRESLRQVWFRHLYFATKGAIPLLQLSIRFLKCRSQTAKCRLRGNDPRLATDTILKFGQLLGKVQVAALGKECDFHAPQVDAGVSLLPRVASQDIRDEMGDFIACLEALRVNPPVGFSNAIDTMEAAIHNETGPFRTWTHCDIKTQNILLLESTQVQLLDFELASIGHALLDAVSVRMAFPPPPVPVINSGQMVPPSVVRRFEAVYRIQIIRGIPEAADDDCFHQALVQACAHWALVKLLSMWKIHLKERLAQGREYDSREDIAPHRAAYARFRQQGVAYLQTFVVTAEEFERLPTIRAVARMAIAALLRVWPEIGPSPYFPAFMNDPNGK